MKIERMQTGVRIESRLLAALDELAKQDKQNLGEKIEEIVLHAFAGKGACAWAGAALKRVAKVKKACGIAYGPHACYSFDEQDGPVPGPPGRASLKVRRVQVGFKIEKRMLKVLKAIAELNDAKLGHLLEEIVLHQMDGVDAFTPKTLKKIAMFRQAYEMDYDVHANYRFAES